MNIVNERNLTVFTFDVELYFGSTPGTTERNIIRPVKLLLGIARQNEARMTFFVDAGHLDFLRRNQGAAKALSVEYSDFARLVQSMIAQGHDVQLHVHPHWEDAEWDEGWKLDTSRFSSDAFDVESYKELFARYKRTLEEITETPIRGFRAGGFCIQGAIPWGEVFSENKILFDSSVYYGGVEESDTHWFDFRNAPRTGWWKFNNDPLEPADEGRLMEIPVTSLFFSPLNFISILLSRKLSKNENKAFGDGRSAAIGGKRKLTYLLKGAFACASVDGGKSRWLEIYDEDVASRRAGILTLIGHPKALTQKALRDIGSYLEARGPNDIVTMSSLVEEKQIDL